MRVQSQARDTVTRSSPRKRTASAKVQAAKDSVMGAKAPIARRRKVNAPLQSQVTDDCVSSGRKPRRTCHCTICPGRPLRRQCCHTKLGQEYLLEQGLRMQVSAFAPIDEQSRSMDTSVASIANLRAEPENHAISHGSNQSIFPFDQTRPFPIAFTTPQRPIRANGPLAMCPSNVTPSPSPLVRSYGAGMEPSLSSVFTRSSTPPPPNILSAIHPQQTARTGFNLELAMSSTVSVFPSAMRSRGNLSSNKASDSHAEISGITSSPNSTDPFSTFTLGASTPSDSATTKHSTPRPTAANPIHGNVQGVLRGANKSYNIVRTRKLPSPFTASKKASKKFRDGMNTIVRKCEELSSETSCYLFVGAQHAVANGGAIHFASPRLCREGGSLTDDLATQFLQTIKQVTDSRRVDVLELQKNLHCIEQRNSRLNEQVIELQTRAQDEVASRRNDLELIREYEARLGISQ